MITATGTVKLSEHALVSYNDPVLYVTGQSTSTSSAGTVNVTIEIKSANMAECLTESLNIPTLSVKDMMVANSVDGASFVENLYSMLEALLKVYLESINQSTIFVLS